jgi:energy-coupling factor transport system permease protein
VSAIAGGEARAARLGPVVKLAAVAVLSVVVVASVDVVTPTVVLVGVVLALSFSGVRGRALVGRAWPLLAAAVAVAAVNAVFATDRSGVVLVEVGPVVVSTGSLVAGAGIGLRVLAIAVPGIVAFATTDPTELADALVQQLRVPARFAIGALAAYRLLPVLAEEWELLTLARRARGVDAGRNPVAKARLFAATVFALLVGAIRRATRLATAMDARGFDANVPRTVARPQRLRRADAVLLAGTVLLAVVAVGTSVLAGTFRPLVG